MPHDAADRRLAARRGKAAAILAEGGSIVDVAARLRIHYGAARALVANLPPASNAGAGWRLHHEPVPVARPLDADEPARLPVPSLAALFDDPAAPLPPERPLVAAVRASAAACRGSAAEIEAALAKLRRARFRVVAVGDGYYLNGSGAAYTASELLARAARL